MSGDRTTDPEAAPADGTGPDGAGPATYGDAIDELEDLLDDLEGADVDVDLLAERVARGVALIRFCRSRLTVVTDEVDQVVSELIAIDGGGEAAGARSGDNGDDDGVGSDDGDGADSADRADDGDGGR